jgi:Zn-finger nucleic acid-binding protein
LNARGKVTEAVASLPIAARLRRGHADGNNGAPSASSHASNHTVSTYRDEALRCPQCACAMQERMTTQAAVDVCEQCSGMWVEWFDGEMTQVARESGGLPEAVPTNNAGGSRTCPSCRVDLTPKRYPDPVDGAEVLRCGECAGAFVPRASFEALTSASPAVDTPDDIGLLEQLAASLRRLFGWSAT